MGAKAEYDPVQRLIILTETPSGGQVTVDVKVDLYSDGKEDWLTGEQLAKYYFPWLAIGGQDVGGGKLAGQLFFLRNDLGWRIRPYEEDHQLLLEGNLFPQDPNSAIFVPTTGENTVLISNTRSNLAETIEVPTSGLTSSEASALEGMYKITRNKQVTDPDSGVMRIYEDDDTGIFLEAPIYEDADGTTPYTTSSTQIERRDRLE